MQENPIRIDYLVVGSGPAGVAAAHALTGRGHHVTIIDVGRVLEDDRRKVVDRMSRQTPDEWNSEDTEMIVGRRRTTQDAVHSKLSFGSSYTFGSSFPDLDIHWGGREGFNHSLAKGGLSNIWGSSLLPNRQEDIAEWPVSLAALEPHYREVMKFVPGTAIDDRLAQILPTYSNQQNPLEPSRQGQTLLADLETNHDALRHAGMVFGRSRLAIRAQGDATRPHCAYCTLCLAGCPYDLIYSSAQTIDDLVKSGKVTYLPDHLVESFQTTGDEVIVHGIHPSRKSRFSLRAGRVFIGTGVLPTAMIVLRSLNAFDRTIRLIDSQVFIYPLLRFRKVDGVVSERMHTSAQAFLEINDKKVSQYLVHIQVYGFSDFLHSELKRTFLRWPLLIPAFSRHFLGRLMIAQGFIHSAESGTIDLALRKNPDGSVFLDSRVRPSRQAFITALKIGWKLVKQAIKLKAVPLMPGLQFPKPGSGYHSGGSFPMRDRPQAFETDVLGRLPEHPRVHLVDASVLPTVPATSITFSMMANAHRIASAAVDLDRS